MRSALYTPKNPVVNHYFQRETFPNGSAVSGTATDRKHRGENMTSTAVSPVSPAGVVLLPLMKRDDAQSLADYVRQKRAELGLSLKEIEQQSQRLGLKIAGSYVNRIENGLAKNPSKDKLLALAQVFAVSVEELFTAAAGRPGELAAPSVTVDAKELRLLSQYRGLTEGDKETLLAIAEAMERVAKKKTPFRAVS